MVSKNSEASTAGTGEASILLATYEKPTMKSIATTDTSIKQGMPVIIHSGVPVVTTEQLANYYGCSKNNIKKNYSCNAKRFAEGKHYFVISGSVLKELKNSVTFGNQVDKRSPKLTLWTERGAARHAKMLETDQAWDVYEALEDYYFNQKEKSLEVAKSKSRQSTATQLTPLRQTAERLITTGLGRLYPDIWKLVHQRFDIEHIHQLQPEQIGEAIEYLNVLEGEFLGKQEDLPVPALNLPEISMQWWYENNFPMRRDNLPRHPGHQPWNDLTLSPAMMYGADTKSPALFLIETLEMMGFDLTGPRIEVETMRIMLRKGKGNVRVCGAGNVKHLLAL